mgnify:CR=1 FL=1
MITVGRLYKVTPSSKESHVKGREEATAETCNYKKDDASNTKTKNVKVNKEDYRLQE